MKFNYFLPLYLISRLRLYFVHLSHLLSLDFHCLRGNFHHMSLIDKMVQILSPRLTLNILIFITAIQFSFVVFERYTSQTNDLQLHHQKLKAFVFSMIFFLNFLFCYRSIQEVHHFILRFKVLAPSLTRYLNYSIQYLIRLSIFF